MADYKLDSSRLPRHIAIIMDGNGRWAKRNKLKIALGHRAGADTLRDIIRDASDLGIKAVSLYAFSTENWRRTQTEIDALMALIVSFFQTEIAELKQRDIRVRILGDKDGLPVPQQKTLYDAEQQTEGNAGLLLCIAVNYGSRAELARAARLLAEEAEKGTLDPETIDEDAFARRLYTAGVPDVDLLIRTSGEMRLSNFLLWQCAYAEFMFPDMLWPDFTVDDFHGCIAAYQNRSRRFGGRPQNASV
jgi:undecaprenyl diphosphate synthase